MVVIKRQCLLHPGTLAAPDDMASRSEPIFSFDLLDVAALDYLAKDALIEKIPTLNFAILGSRRAMISWTVLKPFAVTNV